MKTTADRILTQLIIFAPLVAMPLLLNLRRNALIAPNEEPKWLVFTLLGLVLAISGAWRLYAQCRVHASTTARHPTQTGGLSLPGLFFVVFFVGLAIGVTYAVNSLESINRLTFWLAGGLTFISVSWAVRHDPTYLRSLQVAASISSLLLCLHFWYGFFVDFRDPSFNKFVQFSLIGHFNFTADVLMTLIPLLTWTLLTAHKPLLRAASGFCVITTGFMLITSGSLGGMGGIASGGLIAAGLGITRRLTQDGSIKADLPGKRSWLLWGGLAVVLIGLARLGFQEMPKEYRDQIFLRGEWWNPPGDQDYAKAKSLPPLAPLWLAITPYLGSRTPMWAATSGMIAERPWQGFGTGSFMFEYPDFSKRYDLFADFETKGVRMKTNPHNALLGLASENGVPMMMLFAGLYVWLTVQAMKMAWKQPDAFWLCGVWALWAAGLDAQVNHVFFNPASLFMAALAFGVLHGRLPTPATLPGLQPCRLWQSPATPVVASIAAAWLAAAPITWVISEYYVGEARRLATTEPVVSPIRIQSTWVNARRWSPQNFQALYGLASLTLSKNDYKGAEAYLRAALALAPHHSAGLNLMGTILARLGRLDEAEAVLIKSVRLEPSEVSIRENLEEIRKAKKQAEGTEQNTPH